MVHKDIAYVTEQSDDWQEITISRHMLLESVRGINPENLLDPDNPLANISSIEISASTYTSTTIPPTSDGIDVYIDDFTIYQGTPASLYDWGCETAGLNGWFVDKIIGDLDSDIVIRQSEIKYSGNYALKAFIGDTGYEGGAVDIYSEWFVPDGISEISLWVNIPHIVTDSEHGGNFELDVIIEDIYGFGWASPESPFNESTSGWQHITFSNIDTYGFDEYIRLHIIIYQAYSG